MREKNEVCSSQTDYALQHEDPASDLAYIPLFSELLAMGWNLKGFG